MNNDIDAFVFKWVLILVGMGVVLVWIQTL
jgi:hypothetical protein